jgi:hypothetical protein
VGEIKKGIIEVLEDWRREVDAEKEKKRVFWSVEDRKRAYVNEKKND